MSPHSHSWHDGSLSTRSSSTSPLPSWDGDQICSESRSSLTETLPNLRTPETQNVFQSIVRGRKSWKTLRGGEVVWPPELEAALLEGLESYQPDDSRETRLLGRFPLRNRFISDFIYEKTGKRRTAKQVGSRLQQLRDTCGGKQLLSLLSPCRKPGIRPSNQLYRSSAGDSESSDNSTPSSPTNGDLSHPGLWSQKPLSPSVICIDILPGDAFHPSSPTHNTTNSPATTPPPPSPQIDADGVVRIPSEPRPVRCIDPTVTFLAQSPLSASSAFTVSVDGVTVHSDVIRLVPHQENIGGARLYSTTLVPKFWPTIVQSTDPTKYRIHQTVYHSDQGSSAPLYTAIYKFRYVTQQRYPSFSPPTSPTQASHLEHTFSGLQVGHSDVNVVCDMDYVKPETYSGFAFAQFSGGWHNGHYAPRSDSNQSLDYRARVYDDHDSSRSNSLSPTTSSFPSELANYVL